MSFRKTIGESADVYMNPLLNPLFSGTGRKKVVALCVMVLWAVCSGRQCHGQGELTSGQNIPAYAATAQVRWVAGPRMVNLASMARVQVPEGWRLTDAVGARLILANMKNSLPDDVMGILAPDSGKWFAVLEVTDIGYLKDPDKETIDPAKILKAVRNRTAKESGGRTKQGITAITSVDWEQPPVYDAEKHSFEWALRVESSSAKTLDYTALLLGRQTALQITVIQPYSPSSAISPLKEVLANVSLQEGQRYEDFQTGDKLARVSVAELIVDDKRQAAGSMFTDIAGFVLLYSALPVCAVVLLGGAHLYKKRRLRRMLQSTVENAPVPARVMPDAPVATNKSNNHSNHGNHGNHSKSRRRRLVFDYSKFYTDMVLRNTTLTTFANGDGPANNGHTPETNGAPPIQSTLDLQLVAGLKGLIEEQNRLIQQQTRLMEEKRKLLDEQSALFKRQADMIQNQYSLKFD